MLRDLFSLFPAYAGVILPLYSVPGLYKPFPRTCGGDPTSREPPPFSSAFPRIRGGDRVVKVPGYEQLFSPHTRG